VQLTTKAQRARRKIKLSPNKVEIFVQKTNLLKHNLKISMFSVSLW